MNGKTVINHDLLFFDEIGFNQSSGLVCDGLASNICCTNYDMLNEGERDGSQPNGIGGWITPDGAYARYDCEGCVGVEKDTFQLHRTQNTTILYRNENPRRLNSGIYRCEVPLSVNISDQQPLIQYVGIYQRGQGNH